MRGPRHPVCESPWLQAALRPPGYWAVSTIKVETPGGQGPHLPARLDIPAQGRSLPMRGMDEADVKIPKPLGNCGKAAVERVKLGLF